VKALDIGCGCHPIKGAVHLDMREVPHAEVIHDFNKKLPFEDATFDVVYLFDAVEHADNVLELMEEVYRILKPEGLVEMRTSYYLNPLSWRDITHKHRFAKGSFDVLDKSTQYGKDYGFYTNINFKILIKKLVGRFPCIDLYLKMQKEAEAHV